MGYRLNRLDEPVFMAVPKPMLTEFGIHYRLESCEPFLDLFSASKPSGSAKTMSLFIQFLTVLMNS